MQIAQEPAPVADRGVDPQRLATLVASHFGFLVALLHQKGVRDGDVDDTVQRVFLTVSRKLDTIAPNAERAFVHAVAIREASHARRAYRRRREVQTEPELELTTPSVGPDELLRKKQAWKAVRQFINDMESGLRSVLVLYELEEMCLRSISERLGLPLGTVKTRLRKARAELLGRTKHLAR